MMFEDLLAEFWKPDLPERYCGPDAVRALYRDLAPGLSGRDVQLAALGWYLLVVKGNVPDGVARSCVRASVPAPGQKPPNVRWVLVDGRFVGFARAGKSRWFDRVSGAEIPEGDVFRRPPAAQLILDPNALHVRMFTARTA